jgi:hypothetical protein
MAALPAFRLNMVAKVIDCTTGKEITQKEWSNVFTDNTPVTVLFNDRTSFIAVSGKVVYNSDVLTAVATSFSDYIHTVKEIRAVRNLEKELRKKLAGFNYKPKTLGDLLLAVGVDLKASSEAALQDQKDLYKIHPLGIVMINKVGNK